MDLLLAFDALRTKSLAPMVTARWWARHARDEHARSGAPARQRSKGPSKCGRRTAAGALLDVSDGLALGHGLEPVIEGLDVLWPRPRLVREQPEPGRQQLVVPAEHEEPDEHGDEGSIRSELGRCGRHLDLRGEADEGGLECGGLRRQLIQAAELVSILEGKKVSLFVETASGASTH